MKIFGVGMNYASHNEEMKRMDFHTEEPVIFTKADSALLNQGKPFFVPDWSERVDYEGELVVRICRLGKGIPAKFAHRYYDAVTVGIDFTARDLQLRAKQQGLPWTISKGFDGSAVIGEWVDKTELPDVGQLRFRLDLNGQTVQQGSAADMIWSVDELISYISRFFTLRTGDLLYTGTPAGVGPVREGDRLRGWLEERPVLDFRCC
ncbi:MAG: fumarylacetoacetate hydrolase family protein [Prevotella sp.]|nr:fumarylacetoacetate hydrolase family protein [Prevotella sp.]